MVIVTTLSSLFDLLHCSTFEMRPNVSWPVAVGKSIHPPPLARLGKHPIHLFFGGRGALAPGAHPRRTFQTTVPGNGPSFMMREGRP